MSSPIAWTTPHAVNPVWRLGHRKNPCLYPPRELCGWRNRFDDPRRQYRTLYAAKESITCLRELLADLRPNIKAIAEFEDIFGESSIPSLTVAGVVSAQWRELHVLVHAAIEPADVRLAQLENKRTLRFLHHEHASLLAGFGIKTLNPAEVRTRERIITQQFSRSLHDAGVAGTTFFSRLDGKPCYALFENRSTLKPLEPSIAMTRDWPELIHVCGEYSLILRPMSDGRSAFH